MTLRLSCCPEQQCIQLFIYNNISFTSYVNQQSRNGNTDFQTGQKPSAKKAFGLRHWLYATTSIFSHFMVSIRIVADCVALSCQVTRKLKRATTLEFTTISAIIFIHCYVLCIIYHPCHYTVP